MKMFARIFSFLCGLYVTAALAAYQPGAVVQVPTYAALAQSNFANTPYLSITEAATGLGGGGDFTQQTCTPDGGVCVSDGATPTPHTFLRTIKTGSPVDLRWYGVADATSSACVSSRASCDAGTALAAAFVASPLYANGSVTTGQRSIVLYNSDLVVPNYSSLDCGGNPVQNVNQSIANQAYWKLGSAIVLNNAHSLITTGGNAISNCLIFPAYYTSVPQTIADITALTRQFTGTAVVEHGSNVTLTKDVIWGFDICVDASGNAGVANSDTITQCNNDWFIWGQRGGVEFDATQPSIFVQQRLKANGVPIDLVRAPVTAVTQDGSNQIVATLDNSANAANCPTLSACFSVGQTILVSGFDEVNIRAHNPGDVTNGVSEIDNVPSGSGNGQDGIGAIQPGATITDTGTANCNFTGITVLTTDFIANTVTLSGPPSGCSPNPVIQEHLTFTNNSAGPAGGNRRFIIDAVTNSPDTVTLRGSSYTGPTYTGTTWNSGTSVLKTYDITNVTTGQYVCSSGSAPFCTTPTAFTSATTTSSNINALGTATSGSISVGNASSWPWQGVFSVADGGAGGCTEWIAYHRPVQVDQSGYSTTNINIDGRAQGGTTVCTHANGQTLTASAPQVLAPVPGDNAVIINSVATSTEGSGQSVTFANDNTVTTGLHAASALNFDYLPWTANIYTAGGPFGPFTALATTNNSTTLTNVTNPTRAQPMMSVSGTGIPTSNTVTGVTGTFANLGNQVTLSSTTNVYPGMAISGGAIQADSFITALNGSVATISHRTTGSGSNVALTMSGVVVVSVSGSTVQMNVSASTSASNQKISFGGCGYPAGQPWLGNCPSADHQIGTLTGKSVQGVVLDWPHGGRRNIETQIFNGPATVINKCVYGNGGGEGAQIDPTSVAINIDGDNTDAIRVSNCKFAGTNNGLIINQSMTQNDGTMFDNVNMGSDILEFAVIGTGTNLTLEGIHGRAGPAYISTAGAVGTVLSDTQAPGTQVFSDTTTGLSPNMIRCSANVLLIQLCQDGTGLATGTPTGGQILGGVNTQTGAFKNGVEYSNLATSTFTPTGASTATTIPNFADRTLSIRDFGGVPDWTTNSTSALVAAEAAAVTQGVHTILLDGDSRGSGYMFGTHTVPANIQLVCPGPITAPPTSNDYRNYPQSILLSTTAGLTFSGGSGMHGCNVLQNALANSTPPATFQDNMARALSYTGTAITITGDNVVIENGNIVGFNIGVLTRGSKQMTLQGLNVDAVNAYQIFNQGGGGAHTLDKLQAIPYGTRFGALAEPNFPISSITDNGSGVLQVHLTTPCTGTSCVLNGYPVWAVGGANASVQSAQGGWTAANVTSSTIDLAGSTSAFLTGQTESATTTTGSVVVSGIATGIAQVEPTQSVTGTCIPSGAKIAAVQRSYGVIWLDSAHPASSTGACTVTITDSAPTSVSVVSVAIGNSGGTGYVVGDQVSPSTGTGTAALFDVNEIDNGASGGPGVVTRLGLNDGGSYTVAPSPLTNAATTGGTGTGLTVNLSVGSTLYGSAIIRSGPAYAFSKVTDVRVTNVGEIAHAIGMSFGNGAHSINATNCSLHDENVLQDQTHFGISFTSTSNNVKLQACDSYYFGAAIYSHNLASSNLVANVVSNSALCGAAGTSGLQNTILDMASPTPGTPSKTSLTLSGNACTVAGAFLVMGDERSLNMSLNSFNNSSMYYQNAAAQTLTTGCGNTLANASSPIYCVMASQNITPGALNENGGQFNLNNSATTYTPYASSNGGSAIFDTGPLTNNRNLTLSNTNATAGYAVTLIRVGSSGGFSRNVLQSDGVTLIAAVADGATATFRFNSATNLWVKQ